VEVKEFVELMFQRMENKLNDIKNKNINKVEDPQKLEEAIQKALEVVRSYKEKCLQAESLEEAKACVEEARDAAKQYLGKDMTGLRTAKATFSRCVNMYMKKLLSQATAA